jgi:hypothetical protein
MKALALVVLTTYAMLLDTPTTSKGSLAKGQEDTSQQVEDLSTQTNDALQAASTKLSSSIDLTLTAGTAVLRSKIEDKDDEIDDVDRQIAAIDAELESAELRCSEITMCSDCTSNSDCVWCSVESTCHDGDQDGPTEGECTDFLYESCDGLGCRLYQSCDSCLEDSDCGWCLDQARCNKSSATDFGGCDKDYFYHSEIDNDQCPEYSHTADRGLDTSRREELVAEKAYLEDEKADLQAEADDYQSQVSSLEEEAYKTAQTYIPEVQTEDDLDGLDEQVDELAQGETDEEEQFKADTLQEAEYIVNNNTDSAVQNRTDTLMENEAEMEKRLTEELHESQEQKEKIKAENDETMRIVNETHQETMDGLNSNSDKLDSISAQLSDMNHDDTSTGTTTDATTTTEATTTTDGEAATTTGGETETSGEAKATAGPSEETAGASAEESPEASKTAAFIEKYASFLQ